MTEKIKLEILEEIRLYFQRMFEHSENNTTVRCGKAVGQDHYVISFSVQNPDRRGIHDFSATVVRVAGTLFAEQGIQATPIANPSAGNGRFPIRSRIATNAYKISGDEMNRLAGQQESVTTALRTFNAETIQGLFCTLAECATFPRLGR